MAANSMAATTAWASNHIKAVPAVVITLTASRLVSSKILKPPPWVAISVSMPETVESAGLKPNSSSLLH